MDMLMRFARSSSILILLTVLICPAAVYAVPWFPFGPEGGSARSFAVDPRDSQHLYLGTETGWVYETHDQGKVWKRLSRIDRRDDLVLDNIEVDSVDSKHLLIGAFTVDRPDGGLFVSRDSGASWAPVLQGESVRALAQSVSNPKMWVAGTLTGVQRSDDNGEHWKLISPEKSTEIHEIESVAIDPANPRIIYAGTWHLPWKTTDGGAHWTNIKEGVIDDSDVFSIIVDPVHPSTVYVSACSGIYKSDNAGGRFQKVEGIPSEARRTRVLMQDPKNRDVVFAGTTEGLFRTGDAGKIWIRMTGPDAIINDVFIDPKDSTHILLATDRSGVLASSDGGSSFHSANGGFSGRHLSSFVQDAKDPATVYVGALNDKQWGGVFRSTNGGLTWAQRSEGLEGSDIFSLGQAADGTVLAGTGHGIYRLKDESWVAIGGVSAAVRPPAPAKSKTARAVRPVKRAAVLKPIEGSVFAFATDGETTFAATDQGLLASKTSGTAWVSVGSGGTDALYFLAASRAGMVTANLTQVRLSKDHGATWKTVGGPPGVSQLAAVAVDASGNLWAGGREGAFVSTNDGASWEPVNGLAIRNVNSLFFEERSQRMLVTAGGRATIAYAVQLPERRVTLWDTGWNLRFVRPLGDHLLGITPFDGVVIQPRMVDSAESSRQ